MKKFSGAGAALALALCCASPAAADMRGAVFAAIVARSGPSSNCSAFRCARAPAERAGLRA
jgi:uncharacterized protein YraI